MLDQSNPDLVKPMPSAASGRARISHTFQNPLWVAAQIARGHSLYRVLFHAQVRGLKVAGATLDIGSKTQAASYYEFLEKDPGTEIVHTDLNAAPGVVALNVEEAFPFEAGRFDNILAFNLFEHVYSYAGAPAEMARVLKPGGRFIVCVPFMHEYHADPDDYFRFTASALERIWGDAGLKCVKMEALGEGILTFAVTKVAALVMPRFLYRLAAPLAYLITMPFDRLVALRPRLDGLTTPQRFPLGYYCVFEK